MTTSKGIELHRLGLRLDEFCALTGMSKATLWRRIRCGDVRVVRIGALPLITHAELVRLGLIDPDGLTVKK